MEERARCEFCGREILGEPELRVRRGKSHVYCSEFCFRLHFYKAPRITYEALKRMYSLRCVSVKLD
jgi:ribosome-binding protein aMBF1 (putative translation factor)